MFLIWLKFAFRERVPLPKDEDGEDNDFEKRTSASVATTLESPPEDHTANGNGSNKGNYSARSLLKSASISASKCVVVKPKKDPEVILSIFFLFLAWQRLLWFRKVGNIEIHQVAMEIDYSLDSNITVVLEGKKIVPKYCHFWFSKRN